MPLLAISAGTLLYKHLSKKHSADLRGPQDNNPSAIPAKPVVSSIASIHATDNSGPSRSPSYSTSISASRKSTYGAADKVSLYSFSETIATESEVPTTPPPEYEDITPRASFQTDRELDFNTDPGLGGLPSIITQPAPDLQPSLRKNSGLLGSLGSRTNLWEDHQVPLSTLSRDRTTIATTDPVLLTNAAALTSFIRSQAAVPPVVEIHIIGHHRDSSISNVHGSGRALDFNIRLDLLSYLLAPQNRSKNDPAITNHIHIKLADGTTRIIDPRTDHDLPSPISEIASTFVDDSTTNKCLIIDRSVTNWDKTYLESCVSSLLTDLQYRGDVAVRFYTSHCKVVVQPERTVTDSFKSLFHDSKASGKKVYDGIEGVWVYADPRPPSGKREDETGLDVSASPVASEQRWWNDWKGAIERAVLEGRKGESGGVLIGMEDLLDARFGAPGPARREQDWGMSTWPAR